MPASKIPVATAAGGAKEVKTWKTFAAILDHMTIFKPNPELGVSNSCGFFTSEPHINQTRCLHAPLSKPTRSQTHLPALHPAATLSSTLPLLCSALYILEETGPYTSTDSLRTTFKLNIFTEELAEKSKEKKEEERTQFMTLKTMCRATI